MYNLKPFLSYYFKLDKKSVLKSATPGLTESKHFSHTVDPHSINFICHH